MPLTNPQYYSFLCNLPLELLQRIALDVVPSIGISDQKNSLTSLLCSCKRLDYLLSFARNKYLYSLVFQKQFDSAAARRRYGPSAVRTAVLARQLQRWYAAIKILRTGDVHHPEASLALERAWILMSEDDGMNKQQLEWAGAMQFAEGWIRERMYDAHRSGWPRETKETACALWLYAAFLTEDNIKTQTPQRRSQVLTHILPFVYAPFYYASFYVPANHYLLPLWPANHVYGGTRGPTTVRSVHGRFPVYLPPRMCAVESALYDLGEDEHSRGLRHIREMEGVALCAPLSTISAKVVYFSITSYTRTLEIPEGLPSDRAHARALGRFGISPTIADVDEFNTHSRPWLPASDPPLYPSLSTGIPGRGSAKWDEDHRRWRYCFDMYHHQPFMNGVYTPGTVQGLWIGRRITSPEDTYQYLLNNPHLPPNLPERLQWSVLEPCFARIEEAWCLSPEFQVLEGGPDPRDGFDEGLQTGWLPPRTTHRRNLATGDVAIQVDNDAGGYSATYSKPAAHRQGRCPLCRAVAAEEEDARRHKARLRELQDAESEEEDDDSSSIDCESCLAEVDSEHAAEGDAVPRTGVPAQNDFDDDYESEEEFVEETLRALRRAPGLPQGCDGIQDIFVFGETEPAHAEAWNPFTFRGRVRRWDGLVCIVRTPKTMHQLHQYIFTGYVVGENNIVGTWRAMDWRDPTLPSWEGPFVWTRVKEDGARG